MNDTCRHCDETIAGKAYRVISEEDGVALLNMVVCASCAAVAKSLLLHTEEITPERRTPSMPVEPLAQKTLFSEVISWTSSGNPSRSFSGNFHR
jgi:hypothetical protein